MMERVKVEVQLEDVEHYFRPDDILGMCIVVQRHERINGREICTID
jgi:hypothetical protein